MIDEKHGTQIELAVRTVLTVPISVLLVFCQHYMYLFSRRFSSEKCPTLTVASFFSFFFRQTTISL